MTVDHRSVGQPVHEAERSGIAHVLEGLEERDERYIVWSNIDIPAGGNRSHEHDLIVLGPGGLVTVELKSYHGKITANNEFWIVSHDFQPNTPVPDTKQRARELKGLLTSERRNLKGVWVHGLVFVSGNNVRIEGEPRDLNRIRTRGERPVLDAVVDPSVAGARRQSIDPRTVAQIEQIISGRKSEPERIRRFGEYKLLRQLHLSARSQQRYDAWLAEHQMAGHRRELHIYHLKGDHERFKHQIQTQFELLQGLNSVDEVVRSFDPVVDESGALIRAAVVFEDTDAYMPLRHFLKEHSELSLRKRLLLLERLLAPLAKVHAHDVVHQRLSPFNILVHKKYVLDYETEELTAEEIAGLDLKIGGFEKIREAGSDFTRMTTLSSDPRYQYSAPEILSHEARTLRSDVFSFGVIAAEVLTGDRQVKSGGRAMAGDEMPPLARGDRPLDPELDEFVRTCAASEMRERPHSLVKVRDELRSKIDRYRKRSEGPQDPFAPGAKLAGDYEVYEKLSQRQDFPTLLAEELQTGQYRVIKLMDPETRGRLVDMLYDWGLKWVEDGWRVNLDIPRTIKVDGTPALVLEYVEGISGEQFTEARRLATGDSGETVAEEAGPKVELDRELFEALGRGLFEALAVLHRPDFDPYHTSDHEGGDDTVFLHRDVKPHNVIFRPEADEPAKSRLVIVDPALITILGDDGTPGTEAYKPRAVDEEGWTPRSDVAAAVMTLFEMATGHHPYGKKRPAEERLDLTLSEACFKGVLTEAEQRRFQAFCKGWLTGEVQASDEETRTDAVLALEGFERIFDAEEQRSLITDAVEVPTSRLEAGLADDERTLRALGLAPDLAAALREAGYETIGDLACTARGRLEREEGFESGDIDRLETALRRFAERVNDDLPSTADDLWRALKAFLGSHAEVLAFHYGLRDGRLRSYEQVAADPDFSQVGVSASKVESLLEEAWERLSGGLPEPGEADSGDPVIYWFSMIVEAALPETGLVDVDSLTEVVRQNFPAETETVSHAGLARLGVVVMRLDANRRYGSTHRDIWMQDERMEAELAPLPPWTKAGVETVLAILDERVAWPPVEREEVCEMTSGRLADDEAGSGLLQGLNELEIGLDDAVRQLVDLAVDVEPSGFGGLYRPDRLRLSEALDELRETVALPIALDEAARHLNRWFPGADFDLEEPSFAAVNAAGLGLVDGMLVESGAEDEYEQRDEELELDDDVKVAHLDTEDTGDTADAEDLPEASLAWSDEALPSLEEVSELVPPEAPEIVRSLSMSIDGGVMRILSLLPRNHRQLAEKLERELTRYLGDGLVRALDVDRYLLNRLKESEDGPWLFGLEQKGKLARQAGYLRELFEEWMQEKVEQLEPGTLTLWYNPCLLVEVGDAQWLSGLYEKLRTTPGAERGLLVVAVPGTVRQGRVFFNEAQPVFSEQEMAPVAVREV